MNVFFICLFCQVPKHKKYELVLLNHSIYDIACLTLSKGIKECANSLNLLFSTFTGGTRVHLSDPDMIKYVQVTNASNYIRPSILKRLLPGLGDSLLTTNGPEHALMRKMLNPKFSYGSVKQFASIFNAKTDELIQVCTMCVGI